MRAVLLLLPKMSLPFSLLWFCMSNARKMKKISKDFFFVMNYIFALFHKELETIHIAIATRLG